MANLSNINNKFIVTDGGNLLVNATANLATYGGITINNFSDPSIAMKTTSNSGWLWTQYITSSGTNNFSMGVNQTIPYWCVKAGAGMDSPHLVVNSSGNVGIGTTSPDRSLDVEGNGMVIFGTGDYTELMLRGQVEGTGTVRNVGAFNLSIRGDVGGDNDDLKFLRFITGTFSGTAMQISNSTGNIGIGTNTIPNADYRLILEDTDEDLLRLHNSTDGLDALISFTNPGGTLGRIQGIDNGGLGFDTGNNAGGINTNAMFINSSGNVGIGTASLFSGAKLDVYGDLVLGQQNWAIRGNNANADIGFEELAGGSFSDANIRLYLQSGGNVGIGTTTPDAKVDILGLDLNIGANNGAPTTRTNSTVKVGVITSPHYTTAEENFTGMLLIGNTNVNEVAIGGGTSTYNSASLLTFFTSADSTTVLGTERMRIESTGVVKFPNTAANTGDVGTIAHYTNNYMYIRGGTSGLAIGDDGFGVSVYLNNSDSIQFNTGNGTEKMRINSNGQMWLGGSYTGSDIANGNVAYLNNLNAGGFSILHRNAADVYLHFNTYYNSSNNYIAKYGGSQGFRIDNGATGGLGFYKAPVVNTAGDTQTFSHVMQVGYGTSNNVGIGTTSPDYPLEINSSVGGGGMLSVMSTTTEASISHRVNSGGAGTGWVTGNASNNYFIYSYTKGSQVMTFLPSGNVGIGETSPDYKLDVSGSIRAGRYTTNVYYYSTTNSASNQYFHIKTSVNANSQTCMHTWSVEGYAYGSGAIIDCKLAFHTDSGGNIYGKSYLGSLANNIYKSTDNYVVLVFGTVNTYYTHFYTNLFEGMYTTLNSTVLAAAYSPNNSGVY